MTSHELRVVFHNRLSIPPACSLSPVIPNNGRHLCITAAAGTELAMTSSRTNVYPIVVLTQSAFFVRVRTLQPESLQIIHAVSLGQGFPHCPKFPTAASRRSRARVSVPVWPITLSGRLPIIALVGSYPTN